MYLTLRSFALPSSSLFKFSHFKINLDIYLQLLKMSSFQRLMEVFWNIFPGRKPVISLLLPGFMVIPPRRSWKCPPYLKKLWNMKFLFKMLILWGKCTATGQNDVKIIFCKYWLSLCLCGGIPVSKKNFFWIIRASWSNIYYWQYWQITLDGNPQNSDC